MVFVIAPKVGSQPEAEAQPYPIVERSADLLSASNNQSAVGPQCFNRAGNGGKYNLQTKAVAKTMLEFDRIIVYTAP